MSSSDDNDRLEQLIDSTLRDLPLQRAPAELQLRVLAAIEQRANRPWWRKTFAHWPLPARVAFGVASLATVKIAIDATLWLVAAIASLPFNIESSAVAVGFKTLLALHSSLASSIPSAWIYGALGALAAMYASVFAIGAVGYRTLYASHSPTRPALGNS